jgi:amino acid transporter
VGIADQAVPDASIGRRGLTSVAIAALGGPLALAALYVPQLISGNDGSAGLIAITGAVMFAFPIYIWWRYARREAGSGGLYGYVRTAVGAPIAYAQAALWLISYALYLVYTTEYVVYDVLATVFPDIGGARPALEIVIPILVAAVMVAGRRVSIAVIGVIAIGQLALLAALIAITIGHGSPASSVQATATPGAFASAAAGVGLLYVCGSLPLYFGGEVSHPTRELPRALIVAYAVTAIAVVIAVAPYAANPAFTRADIPGVSLAQVFAGRPWAVAIGIGVAVSILGVLLIEYMAVARLVHAISGRSIRMITIVVAALVVASGPISLIDPNAFYDALIRPSLIALWLSQLIAVAVFPWFVRRYGRPGPVDIVVTLAAVAILGYGLYGAIAHAPGS